MPDDIIVYDIETQETFQDIGSRDPKKLHISLIGAYSYQENKLISFVESEFPLFWRRLEQAALIVGFNNHGFDDQVCAAYFPEMPKVPSFDILEEVYNNLGFRIKLDNIAQATLGEGKSGDGLKAIKLYREGKIDELRSYCLDDVRITKEIYDYGKLHGRISYSDLQGVKQVSIDFNRPLDKPSENLNLSLF
ncbi:ribonuclease H-like domain-containing protein [Patescibacteria group bacterium]|nr:ribonuclease H-like domain-containing protein [Patescibacteria group bacterium]